MDFSDVIERDQSPAFDRDLLRKFREQIHALGALWIIMGSLTIAAAVVGLLAKPRPGEQVETHLRTLLMVAGGLGVLWFILGVLTCLKHMWAVYVATVLSYVSLVGQIFDFRLIAAIILVIVISQAHRVIGWSRKMAAAGVPLTAKP